MQREKLLESTKSASKFETEAKYEKERAEKAKQDLARKWKNCELEQAEWTNFKANLIKSLKVVEVITARAIPLSATGRITSYVAQRWQVIPSRC